MHIRRQPCRRRRGVDEYPRGLRPHLRPVTVEREAEQRLFAAERRINAAGASVGVIERSLKSTNEGADGTQRNIPRADFTIHTLDSAPEASAPLLAKSKAAAGRDETPLPSDRLNALRDFAQRMARERGAVDDAAVQAFLDAGFGRRQVLEVVLGVAQKVMRNYVNHLPETRWTR